MSREPTTPEAAAAVIDALDTIRGQLAAIELFCHRSVNDYTESLVYSARLDASHAVDELRRIFGVPRAPEPRG